MLFLQDKRDKTLYYGGVYTTLDSISINWLKRFSPLSSSRYSYNIDLTQKNFNTIPRDRRFNKKCTSLTSRVTQVDLIITRVSTTKEDFRILLSMRIEELLVTYQQNIELLHTILDDKSITNC